jgi:uncharacterized membrane protein
LRLKHLDRVRAIAVLCMVQVHTAAIIPPEGITVGHPAAFVAAAFGGMAAPLFVTISGWGMYRSASRRAKEGHNSIQWARWIIPRVVLLCLCQLLVNLLLNVDRGGRFEWHTPGVLTLLAISAVICPIFVWTNKSQRSIALLLLCVSPILLGSISGQELGWFDRVGAADLEEWLSRLLWNGTYPVLPWMFYVILGTLLNDFMNDPKLRERGIILGLIATSVTILISVIRGVDWALTSGDAVLTFFPASMAFLLVSGTMVALLMRMLEGDEISGGIAFMGDRLSSLEPAGRLSLTIYVAHFAVLGILAVVMDGEPRMPLIPAFIVTIIHTAVWIPLAILHERVIPRFSLEEILRAGQSSR